MKKLPVFDKGIHVYDTTVDDADYEVLRGYHWYASKKRGFVYAVRATGVSGKSVQLHREILGLVPGDGFEADHKNRDTLDNQRANLRVATRSRNSANRPKNSRNKTGFKGVSVCKQTGRYRAGLTFERRRINLQRYDTAEEAAHAYDRKALELWGEFAFLNFPLHS